METTQEKKPSTKESTQTKDLQTKKMNDQTNSGDERPHPNDVGQAGALRAQSQEGRAEEPILLLLPRRPGRGGARSHAFLGDLSAEGLV